MKKIFSVMFLILCIFLNNKVQASSKNTDYEEILRIKDLINDIKVLERAAKRFFFDTSRFPIIWENFTIPTPNLISLGWKGPYLSREELSMSVPIPSNSKFYLASPWKTYYRIWDINSSGKYYFGSVENNFPFSNAWAIELQNPLNVNYKPTIPLSSLITIDRYLDDGIANKGRIIQLEKDTYPFVSEESKRTLNPNPQYQEQSHKNLSLYILIYSF